MERDAEITFEKIWLDQKEETTCEHEWEPAFTVAYNAFVLILFPGMRCKKCLIGRRCIPDRRQALKEFEEYFHMSFEAYFKSRCNQLSERYAEDLRTWTIAGHQDYRLLVEDQH